MTNLVVNGAPHVVELGIKDSSRVVAQREPEAIPQHLPKVFIFAERGTEAEWLGVGNEREVMYGAVTFDERSRYFTHSTMLSNVVNAQGNICMYKRLVPADAGPSSNFTLWLDVLETTVDLYERNADGSLKTVNGDLVVTGTAPGFKVKWVKTFESDLALANTNFGTLAIREGSQVDPTDPQNRSSMYPVVQVKASSRGAWANNVGMRLWALDSRIDALPEKLIAQRRTFPYELQIVERDPVLGTTKIKPTVLNDSAVMFVLKQHTVDPSTDKDMYLADTYLQSYEETDTRYPIQHADLSGLAVYHDIIQQLVTKFHAAEVAYIDAQFHDFTANPEDANMFNIFSGKTLNGYEYNTFRFVTGGVNLNRYETIYADGGSDGTLSNTNFENLVIEQVRRYKDDYDEIQDKALHVESHLYDTGFSLDTKFELAAFIALRGDTFVTFGTFQEGDRSFDSSEQLSIAQALKARLMNLPESSYFGTQVVRAGIYGGDCTLRAARQTGKRRSTVYEVAHKRAKYMGAANGRWTTKMEYDRGAPGSLCEITTNHSSLWVPVKVRYRFWDAGLNWWARFDRSQSFCPAFKTVYSDETSLLIADSFVQCCIQLNKVNDRSWRAHSGTVGDSDAVFVQRVNDFITKNTLDRFDNRFPVVPDAMITEADRARGKISWHSRIKVYGDPMRTVALNYVEAFRNAE